MCIVPPKSPSLRRFLPVYDGRHDVEIRTNNIDLYIQVPQHLHV